MPWQWGPTNWLWQVVHHPTQLLDIHYASQWYEAQAASPLQWAGSQVASGLSNPLTLGKATASAGAQLLKGGAPVLLGGNPWLPMGSSGGVLAGQVLGNVAKGVGSALNFVPVFTQNTVGSPEFYIAYGKAGLTTIGGFIGAGIGAAGGPLAFITVPAMGFVGSLAGRGLGEAADWASTQIGEIFSGPMPSLTQILFAHRGLGATVMDVPLGGSLSPHVGIGANGGSHLPNVGGILFENCAAVLTGVGEITGAYWDARTGSLVLVGKNGAKNSPAAFGLPGIDRDHLLVALRAYLAGQPIGVSIDPPAEYRDGMQRGVTPPDGTPMLVSYLGNTEGTLFGAIMFEADRLLKCLDKGTHNETRKPLRATVPGFRSLLEMIHPSDGRRANVWHRFWFVIDKVELRHDAATDAVVFGDVRLKVLTETEVDGGKQRPVIDAADEAFTRHLTEHYDEYARDFPILARLKELAKVAAVAKFLVNRGVKLDNASLFATPSLAVATPPTTPGISVVSPNTESSSTGTRTVSLFGGVDMDPDPEVLPDTDSRARLLNRKMEAARPSPTARTWAIRENGDSTCAVALPVGAAHTPARFVRDDHEFVAGGHDGPVRIRRVYDSSFAGKGEFGPGWSLWIPFSITVFSPSGKRAEVLTRAESPRPSGARVLVLHDHTTGQANVYRPINEAGATLPAAFCRVTSQTSTKEGVSFQYDPQDRIRQEGDELILDHAGRQYRFDGQGRPLEIRDQGRCVARYQWENDRIVRILNAAVAAYHLHYDGSNRRIVRIDVAGGTSIQYTYDRSSRLFSIEGQNRETYAYDSQGRLTEVRDHNDRVIRRYVYNGMGKPVNDSSDVIASATGAKLWRNLVDGEVHTVRDEAGTSARFQYGSQSQLLAVEIGDQPGSDWQLGYDLRGQLRSFRDPLGRTTNLHYDEQGRVSRCSGPDDTSRSLQYDDQGRVCRVTDQNGYCMELERNDTNHVRRLIGSNGGQWEYTYWRGMLLGIRGPAGGVRVRPRRKSLTVQTRSPNGSVLSQVYDRSGRLTTIRNRGAQATRFKHAEAGSSFQVETVAGRIRYEIDESSLAMTLAFDTN